MINWAEEQGIAVIVISNPPLNASNHAVRSGIITAFTEISDRNDIVGVIITGDGKNFVAGSDIKEFGAPLAEPQMPDVISCLEEFHLPIIAAIRGACLGGGYELSLGCDYRLATHDALLGLPEVGLGIVPGAGGTQKLPRLVGIPKALELILGAVRVKAREAAKFGMIDQLIDGDLMEAAFSFAKAGHPKRRIIDMAAPILDEASADPIREKALRRAKNRPAAKLSAELIYSSSNTKIAEGLTEERRIFQDIRILPEAFALRHVFFAERGAAKFKSRAKSSSIAKIAVVGGGTMGAGIAYAMLKSGLFVRLIERNTEACASAKVRVESLAAAEAKRGFITDEKQTDILGRFTVHEDVSGVSAVDLILEAVFEDMTVKKELLTSFMPYVSQQTIIATNTSYLDIDEMAHCVKDPSRFIGLHFFSPAQRMSLLEIVRGTKTSDATIMSAFGLTRKLGKQPVLAGNAYGFIGNRIYAAYRRHAEYVLQDGASVDAIDRAMSDFGMAMGPLEVGDMSGLDIAWRMRQARGKIDAQRYVDIPDRLCEEGRFGRKTGAGYYRYEGGKKEIDPHTAKVVAQSQADAGITPAELSVTQIQDRLLGAIVIEALSVLSEGIATKAGDVDVAMIHGYGFPRWTGGPLYLASQLPKDRLADMFAAVQTAEQKPLPIDKILTLIGDLT